MYQNFFFQESSHVSIDTLILPKYFVNLAKMKWPQV